jgi:hypothetical protein
MPSLEAVDGAMPNTAVDAEMPALEEEVQVEDESQ